MFSKFKYTFLLIFLLSINYSDAQESMMPDVSYRYLETLIATAKRNYPKMRVYDQRVAISKLNIHKAKLDWLSIFTLTFLYSPNNTTTIVNPSFLNGYQIGLYTNMGYLVARPSTIKLAKKELEISKADQAEYDLNIEAIVKERYFLYIQRLTVLNWKTKTAQDAESSVKLIKYKFEKGEETLENYNKELTFYSNAMQFKIEAEGSLLIAKSSLEEIVGKKLDDIK